MGTPRLTRHEADCVQCLLSYAMGGAYARHSDDESLFECELASTLLAFVEGRGALRSQDLLIVPEGVSRAALVALSIPAIYRGRKLTELTSFYGPLHTRLLSFFSADDDKRLNHRIEVADSMRAETSPLAYVVVAADSRRGVFFPDEDVGILTYLDEPDGIATLVDIGELPPEGPAHLARNQAEKLAERLSTCDLPLRVELATEWWTHTLKTSLHEQKRLRGERAHESLRYQKAAMGAP